ncbi:MAG: 3'-5' exonuclease [Bacteroidales bacterium]|nr:3'-5' exonuclease [Bacteroidales bacterium]
MRYLFFDTETTGFPPRARLVSIAWQIWNNETLEKTEYYVIKPEGFTIPYEAERVHGISTDYALQNGVDIRMVLDKFFTDTENSEILVAHNYNFDAKMMDSEYKRAGITSNLPNKNVVDTMLASTKFLKLPAKNGRGYKWPRLEELYTFLFEQKFDNAHSANADVDATVKCFFELKKRGII